MGLEGLINDETIYVECFDRKNGDFMQSGFNNKDAKDKPGLIVYKTSNNNYVLKCTTNLNAYCENGEF